MLSVTGRDPAEYCLPQSRRCSGVYIVSVSTPSTSRAPRTPAAASANAAKENHPGQGELHQLGGRVHPQECPDPGGAGETGLRREDRRGQSEPGAEAGDAGPCADRFGGGDRGAPMSGGRQRCRGAGGSGSVGLEL